MTISKALGTIAKAALFAGALGTMGMAAAPAQAATGSITFTFGNSAIHNGAVLRFSNGHFFNNYCLTDYEIRSALRSKGFHSVSIVRDLGHHRVLAVGQKYGRWYQLLVNACTGEVNQQRIYRRSNGSFSFTFNFGGGYGSGSNGDYGDHGGYGDNGGSNDHGGYGGGGNTHEELVCLVTFFDESQVSAGADADVESARVLPRSVAERLDQPNDRRAIFDYGTDAQTTATCNHLDSLNN